MPEQVPIDASARADETRDHGLHVVANDLAYQRIAIVNVIYWGVANAQWVLIDTGIPGSAEAIRRAATARFGADARPAAIVLTHGHFDHVGALRELAEGWDVPIYAHEREHPYLTGRAAYPPPDPTVGGGLMSALARFYPKAPIDVHPWLQPLPDDGSVPSMTGWRWIATPGHTPGHISLWRTADRTLIAGDAVITTRQESAFAVALQTPEIHGPPMYYTPDWPTAQRSAEQVAQLEPNLLITGHGPAMSGAEMRAALHTLARDFAQVAVPDTGRYVPDASETP